jgi:hypothetical protein
MNRYNDFLKLGATRFTMAIIKVHPTSKTIRRDEDIFSRLIGQCITRWAFIDRALFDYCDYCLGGRSALTAVVYYRTPQLSQRLGLVDELLQKLLLFMKGHIPTRSTVAHRRCEEMSKEWRAIKKRLDNLMQVRNVIAHQPMLRVGTAKKHGRGERAHYFFSIVSEWRDAGARDKKRHVVRVDDLRAHFKAAEKMIGTLTRFLARLDRFQKTSAKRFSR